MAGSTASAGLEEWIWLCPIEDRRRLDSSREGMIEGFSLGNYLLLVDYTGRLFREGKAAISAELAGIFERLGSNAENWQARLREAGRGPIAGPVLRRQPGALARNRHASGRAPPGEPGRLFGAMMTCRRPDSWLGEPFFLAIRPTGTFADSDQADAMRDSACATTLIRPFRPPSPGGRRTGCTLA